jgi:ribonuclease-3
MAKIRSHVVSRPSCAEVARALGLDRRLVTRGENEVSTEELEKLAANRNVLAAVLEAALAALFLEHGFEPIEHAVVEAFGERIEYARTGHVDHKTELQETLAREGRQVSYSVLEVDGPPHDRMFTSAAMLDGEQAGLGRGPTKKAAEQSAAREALAKLADGSI